VGAAGCRAGGFVTLNAAISIGIPTSNHVPR
jgi:hypothetical protein